MNDWTQTAKNQRAFCLEVAEKIDRGEGLTDFERDWAVAALKLAAKSIPLTKPKPIGKPRLIEDRSELFMLYATQRALGHKHTKACETLAEEYGVSYQGILKIINDKKNVKEIEAAVSFIQNAKKGR